MLIRGEYVTQADCTDTLPVGWTESFCPEDITRIEYQIPMNEQTLAGDTINQINLFLDWIIANYQNSEFRLRTNKIKKYFRTINQLNVIKPDAATKAPLRSGIKYRRSFDNFQESHAAYGLSSLKYKNDLTLEVSMSTTGTAFDFESVNSTSGYYPLFGTKVEPNVFVDACTPVFVDTVFSAKIEFDDDATFGTNDTNGVDMIDTSIWRNALNNIDAFYCGDCSINSCICCDVEQYIEDFCGYYDDTTTSKTFQLREKIDYILDIDFYWYKNADYNYTLDQPVETSKGKLTFQARFSDMNAFNNEIPNDHSTELSVKLYKTKTDDGEWANLKSFSEDFIDSLIATESNGWMDHTMCPSTTHCCTDLAPAPKWETTCNPINIQNQCEAETTNCKWIPCGEVGDCERKSGPQNLLKRCRRQKTKEDCEAFANGNCEWTLKYPAP